LTTPRFIAKPFFEPAQEDLRFLPEGPRVMQNHPRGPGLLGWVAIQYAADRPYGSLNLLDLTTGVNQTIPLPGRPGFFAETTRPGVVLVGLERRLIYCNLLTGDVEESGLIVTNDERVIINDGLAVEGGVLFGTKHLNFELPIAGLYYLDSATQCIHQVLDGQICSNGKVLQRDATGATLIDIDSRPKTIGRFRLNPALDRILAHNLLADPGTLPGFPDGLRPSPHDQSVIVAFYNPDHVSDGLARQFCPDTGAVLAEWSLPGSPRVTCPEFIEQDGQVRVVFTTAVEGMPAATRAIAPGAGSMYIADTPFTAVPAPPPLVRLP
jgi:sugar lactone lactonase YvrE